MVVLEIGEKEINAPVERGPSENRAANRPARSVFDTGGSRTSDVGDQKTKLNGSKMSDVQDRGAEMRGQRAN
jgi:hypothetical protein